jgi:hypothetical protein
MYNIILLIFIIILSFSNTLKECFINTKGTLSWDMFKNISMEEKNKIYMDFGMVKSKSDFNNYCTIKKLKNQCCDEYGHECYDACKHMC